MNTTFVSAQLFSAFFASRAPQYLVTPRPLSVIKELTQPRFYPQSAKIMQGLRWANSFVPEGLHDSSQARSAWGSDTERPRRGGTAEVIDYILVFEY
jgi:hypothetical protein